MTLIVLSFSFETYARLAIAGTAMQQARTIPVTSQDRIRASAFARMEQLALALGLVDAERIEHGAFMQESGLR